MGNPWRPRGVYRVRREHLHLPNSNPWGNSSSGGRRPPPSVNVNLERYCDKRFALRCASLLSSMVLSKNQNVRN